MKWPQRWVAAFVVTLPAGKGKGKGKGVTKEASPLIHISGYASAMLYHSVLVMTRRPTLVMFDELTDVGKRLSLDDVHRFWRRVARFTPQTVVLNDDLMTG